MAPIAFFPFEFTDIPGVACAFTSRRGGFSEPPHDSANLSYEVGDEDEAVQNNRMALAERLGFSNWLECIQVHGDVMHVDPTPARPEARATLEGDGLATATAGQALIIKTADCQPILLAHKSGKQIAALHVGWRGNKINFPASGVQRFCDAYGLDPAEVYAVRGPSLGPNRAEFVNFEDDFGPGFDGYFNPDSSTVDLWQMTLDQLMGAGIPEKQIFSMDLCTFDREDTFFSYRKACASPVKGTGRQAGVIWIKE